MALPASFKSLRVMLSGPVDLLVFRALTFVCIERCEITCSEEWSFDTHICCIYYLG